MAVNYNQLETYKTLSSSYDRKLKNAKEADKNATSESRWETIGEWTKTGTTIGTSIGGVAGNVTGALLGAGIGAIGGFIGGLLAGPHEAQTDNQDATYSSANADITEYLAKASQTQQGRNELINQTNYFINSSKASFENTYGKESFNMLNYTINSLLDMDNQGNTTGILGLIGGLRQDEIIGNIETRILDQSYLSDGDKGRISREDLDSMYSKYLDISDMGTQYVKFLYDKVTNSDTTIGDTARQLSAQENMNLEKLDMSTENLIINAQSQFADLFLSTRNSNISNAEQMGATESESASSGIKASSSSRTSNKSLKLKQDIANASTAIILQRQKDQIYQEIQNGQVSRAEVIYNSRNQMQAYKRQVKESLNASMNQFFHTGTEYAKSIGEAESETDIYMSGVESAKDFLKKNDQTINENNTRIYNVESATK